MAPPLTAAHAKPAGSVGVGVGEGDEGEVGGAMVVGEDVTVELCPPGVPFVHADRTRTIPVESSSARFTGFIKGRTTAAILGPSGLRNDQLPPARSERSPPARWGKALRPY